MKGVFQLVLEGDDALAPAQGDAEEPCQRGDHLDGLVIPACLGHPDDRIQGIVEEMGVDLGLEHLQLAAALLPLLLDDVVHQVAHGGHHGADGVAQPLHLIAARLFFNLHVLLARLQLLDGVLQPPDGVGDIGGDAEIEEGQQEGGEEQQGHAEQQRLLRARGQVIRRYHAHQLPAGVAHGLDRDLSAAALKGLPPGAVPVGGGRPVILLLEPGIDQLLSGVVDQLPVPVDEVEISAVGQLHVPAHLLNAREAHVHQQHAALGDAAAGELDVPAQGHHPAVPVVRVVKEPLDVGRGEVEVLHLLHGRLEPAALLGEGGALQAGQGCRGHQRPAAVKDRDGHQGVPVFLIEQAHAVGQAALRQIGGLDDPVVHGVRDAHHPPQVAVQVHVDLVEHPLGVVLHQRRCGVGEAQHQAQAHKHHTHNGHGGEGEGDDHLDAHLPVPARKAACKALKHVAHDASFRLLRPAVPPGTWRA